MTGFQCPICGSRLEVRTGEGGWKRQEWNSYAMGPGAAPLEAGAYWYRKEPARSPTGADVGVPAAWSGLTGVALSLLSIPLTVWLEWPWWAPLLILGGGAGLTWLLLLIRWQNLLWIFEEITGRDLDGDGEKGQKRQGEPFRVEFTDPKAKKVEVHHWPINEEQVRQIGHAIQRGVALSKRELAKNTSLSEEVALEALSFMRSKAYAIYKDGNTTILTGRGEHFFKQLLAE